MGRSQSGTKSGVQESMHEYPYSVLAFMIVLTGFLNYIMLHFNPVKFVINLLLTKLTSIILDAPPLFMVMLFFIAIGCKDSGTTAGSSSGCDMQAPTVDSSGRENSTHRASPLNRRPLPRSWPSWDWLQPYDPELFLRADNERNDKEGSRVGEIDRKSSGIRPGEFKVPDSTPELDITSHHDSNVPDAAADPSEVTNYKCRPNYQPTQVEDFAQQHTQSLVKIPSRSLTGGKETSTDSDGIKTYVVDPFQPVSEGSNPMERCCVELDALNGTKETDNEVPIKVCVTQTCEPRRTSSNSGFGGGVLNGETCYGCVHHSSAQESIDECTRGIRGPNKVSSDPEPASEASKVVMIGDPDNHDHGAIDVMQDLESGASSADCQLISVGSLKEWNQPFGGEDVQSDEQFWQGQKDANEIAFPTVSHVLSTWSPCTEVNKEHAHASSSLEYFNELSAGTFATEPVMVMKDPDSNCFSEFESAPPENMNNISRVYSFTHTTMDEKGEEQLYWNLREARPGELESWRRALLCNCKPTLDNNLFQATDGSRCTCIGNAFSVVHDSYKPSAPPFNPLLFYEKLYADRGDSLFFKSDCACTSCEHFVTDEGAICLFNRLEPTSPQLYPCSCNVKY